MGEVEALRKEVSALRDLLHAINPSGSLGPLHPVYTLGVEIERLRALLAEVAKWSNDDCGRCRDNVDRIFNFQRAALPKDGSRDRAGTEGEPIK